jgi:hypothetical protein
MTSASTRQLLRATGAACATLLVSAGVLHAVPQTVQSLDTPHCDVLQNLTLVDELGLAPVFPPDEMILATSTFTQQAACPSHEDPAILNALVNMTNLTNNAFTDVFYVGDPSNAALPGTTIGNEDGLVNAGQAFRIDRLGVNRPLVFESSVPDGIFTPGETWRFIIDDYRNGLGLPAHNFLSIGVGAASPGPPSSGSIIALIPEPSSLALTGAAGALFLRRRRSG